MVYHSSSNLPDKARTAGTIICIVLATLGTLLNILTLVSIVRVVRKSRTTFKNVSMTLLIFSLNVSNLLYSCIGLPVTADTFANCSICNNNNLCRFFAYIFYCIIGTMFCSQAAIGFNRYINVCHFEKPPFKFTKKVNILLLLAVWIFPALNFLLPLTGAWGTLGYDDGTGTCTVIDGNSKIFPRRILFGVGLGIPILIIFYCYVRIYWTFHKSSQTIRQSTSIQFSPSVKHHTSTFFASEVLPKVLSINSRKTEETETKETDTTTGVKLFYDEMNVTLRERDSRRAQHERRLTLMLFITFVAFAICSVPPAIILIIDPDAANYPSWHIPMYTFGWMFSVINPFIYVIFNEAYKETFKQTLVDIFICSRWKCFVK